MTQERLTPESVRARIVEYMKRGELGVGNYVLKGPIDVPTEFENFVALFPGQIADKDVGIVAVGTSITDTLTFYSRILELELPDRVKTIMPDIQGDPNLKRAVEDIERFHTMMGMPTRVLAFGEARDTKEEVIVLFATVGVHPQLALEEIKERIRSRLTSFN